MKKSFKISIGAAVLCCVASLVSTASASTVYPSPNGQWTAYPGPAATYSAAVQQPINADGTSKFKANGNAVIPVKFALSQGAGPLVFESTSTGYTYSFLSFTPTATVTFNDITEVSAGYLFTTGNCHGGALRWAVSTSGGQTLSIYYGEYPNFADCTTTSQTGANMIGMSDLRYDLTQYGGPFYGSYADAQALMGTLPITGVSLVLDGGWAGDQRLTLTSAKVTTVAFSDTFTPQVTAPTPTCPTGVAYIGITKTAGGSPGPVNEPMTIQPQDYNGTFRIVDCKYMYNLATGSLSGVGTYRVSATIDNTTFTVATFDLK